TYIGKLFGKDCVLSISGIGKVNAGLTTQMLIDKYSPEFVLNFGTAGGIDKSVNPLEYYAVEKSCQFDFDLRDLDGVPLGYIQDYDLSFFPSCTVNFPVELQKKNLATADRFTESQTDTQDIRDIGCNLRDMEGGAIAQVCYTNNVPLLTIKGITDVVGNGLTAEQFFTNLKTVSLGFNKVIENLFNKI
ncbi:MAG: 5'-methylthioadenosine/S-adenosylhomocysteine nucleosidase, partial [Clostridia bacterium]|nr:5'-methylthioadenosine/S-adenosylhomocysteine nucleosidase [Clostridia bacterium]